MTDTKATMRWTVKAAAGLGLALLATGACGDVPVENELTQGGIIEGTVTYQGPLPCTQRGHVLGSAYMLIFNEKLLPPPAGLGTSARSLATVSGDVLFAGVADSLQADPTSDRVICPPAGSPTVSVSATWSVGPLPAGRFQVRGFYDYDGDFSPVLRIHNLPTAGDVGGGALTNPIEASKGAAPIYQTFELGVPDASGVLRIPKQGAMISGATVSLGLVLPFNRPIAHIGEVVDERPVVPEAERQNDPRKVTVPVDHRFVRSPTSNSSQADKEFVRIRLRPSLPEAEWSAGLAPPLSLQVGPPYTKFYMSAGRKADGSIASIPEKTNPPIADLFPQVVFSKLDEIKDPRRLTSQSEPAVTISGLVTDRTLINSTAPAWGKKGIEAKDEITVQIRPSVLCLRPADFVRSDVESHIYLVTPAFRSLPTDEAPEGEQVVDPNDVREKLAIRFGKPTSLIHVVEGCLPPGKFTINLVYETGQAWTLPNESGICQSPLEELLGDGCKQAGQPARPRLLSQDTNVFLGGELKPGYCDTIAEKASAAAPANGGDRLAPEDYIAGVPKVCLTQAEINDPAALKARMSQKP